MSQALLWLIVAIGAAVVEVLSPLFGFIFAAVAAVLAAACARMGLPLPVQVGAFTLVLLFGVFLLRPRLLSLRSSPAAPGVPSRTDRLLGQAGHVTQAIDPSAGTGRVLVGGEDWAASAERPLPEGSKIVVNGADGIVLTVASVD
jgi:membrane protein implicated in regulation of membrane protease activity